MRGAANGCPAERRSTVCFVKEAAEKSPPITRELMRQFDKLKQPIQKPTQLIW